LDGATGDLGLYLNGVLVSQTNTTLRPLRDLNPNSEPTLGIGNHGGTFHHFPFHGSVDEWALYARALSGAEIQSIFNAGAAGKCADAPSQVNLVFNGSFELGTVPPGTIDGLNSTAIVGWTVQDIDYYESPWVAGDGLRSLDMNGWIPGRISQEVSGFVVGQTYRLTFLMAGNPYFIPPLPAIKRLRATIGTASREYSFDATGRSESDLGWISQTLDFTATSPVMGLSFASLTDSAGGAALDKVSITLLTNAPPTPTNCVSLPSGLVAWWRGDGDAEDATSAHDGELLFGTTFSPGVSGQAFTFDLSRARVSIPDSDAFKLTNSLSFEGWINVASYAPGIIFIRGDNRGGLDPYHMSIQPSGQLYWGIHTEDNNVAGLLSPGVMSTGVWTHVAAVLDGATGNMGLYVNGSLVNQTNTSLRPLRDLDPNWEPAIGIGNAGGTFHHFPYHGSVDEWALYSRALSTAEIQGIYNAGAAGKCSDTNLPPQRVFDLSSDFSLAANPNGPWSYGHRTNRLAGALQLLNTSRTFGAENGVPIDIWQWNNAKPWVAKVIGPETAVSTHFNAPAGTIYFGPDPERSPEDFAVIRFTVPPGAGGTYQLETTVRSLYDSTRSVDADFHVVKNGIELFGRLVPPNSGTSFSNTLSLAAGDRIDFVAGRGTNGLADTGLKIQTTLVRLTNVPPPPSVVYDVSSDFSARSNSEGPWNYGWKSGTIGAFSNFNFSTTATYENGVSVQIWGLAPSQYPVVYHNGTTNIGLGNGGQEVSPPGTVIFTAGHDGQPQNFGVIRFTVPHQAGGQYRLESAVRTYLDGDRCGDTDYHVVVNDVEVFNEFLAPRTGTAYTNAFNLAEGDTIDFMVGRGADGVLFGSGLKIHAALKSMPLGLMSIDAVSVLGVGSIRVTGHAPPGTICQLQRSTNLIDWEDAGSVVPTTSGVFEFIDSQPANGPACFYRLRGSDR
jgi:choice-of-anchor C domain-containing protein